MKRLLLIFGAVLGCLVLWSGRADAAVLYVTPSDATVAAGDSFIVTVAVNGEKEVINAVRGTLDYPTDLLKVVDVGRGSSFLTLWPEEPTVDEAAGTIAFTGGIPNGTYAFDATVLEVTFRAIQTGTAFLEFDTGGSSVYLNDASGTPAQLTIAPSSIGIVLPERSRILLSSPTHPSEDQWSRNTTVTIRWTPHDDAFYSFILTQNDEEVPDEIPEEATDHATYENIGDGIWTFALTERQAGDDWTIVGRYRIRIDTILPLPFTITQSQDRTLFNGDIVIHFATTDQPSGIERYDVTEGDTVTRDASSPFALIRQGVAQEVTVTAYDKAGNTRSETIQITPTLTVSILRSVVYIFTVLVVSVALILVFFVFASYRRGRRR